MAKKKAPKWKHHLLPKTSEFVNSVAISGDGSRVVAGTYFYNLGPTPIVQTVGMYAYNGNGKSLWGTSGEFSATYGINCVAISRDGAWAASVGEVSGSLGFINGYEVDTGNMTTISNPASRVRTVALNGDGSILVAGGDALYLSVRSGMPSVWSDVASISFTTPSPARVERVAVSLDGVWIAAAIDGGVVALIPNNIANGGGLGPPALWTLSGYYILWVAFAADGSGFAAAGGDGNVYYFDVNSFKATSVLTPAWSASLTGCATGRSVAVNDNGSLVAVVADVGSLSGKGKVFLFDNTGKQLWGVASNHSTNGTSIDSVGKYVAVADGYQTGGSFTLFDATDGSESWSHSTNSTSIPVQISSDGSAVVAGDDDGYVYYFAM